MITAIESPLKHIQRNETILFSSLSEQNSAVSEALCYFPQTASSSVFWRTGTMSLQHCEYAQSQHVDGACWRFFVCVLQALNSVRGVSLSLPLNVQNCQCGAGIW